MRRIQVFLVLVVIGVGLMVAGVFVGADSGLTWLQPAANKIMAIMDILSFGVGAAFVALFGGLLFIWWGIKALFKSSKPDV